jgi:hypothetical protein
MAYGLHWEWRGFGALEPTVRLLIEGLPRLFPSDAAGVDSYYWYPACDVNIKIRDWEIRSGVKLKRPRDHDAETGFRLWLENEREDFSFPLGTEAARTLAGALRVEALPPERPMGRCSLLTLLREARPDLVVVAVRKTRSIRRWVAGDREVLVDIAEITSPELVTSVGLEDCAGLSGSSSAEEVEAAKRDVVAAREALGLPGALTSASYLDAVGAWATGGAVVKP